MCEFGIALQKYALAHISDRISVDIRVLRVIRMVRGSVLGVIFVYLFVFFVCVK